MPLPAKVQSALYTLTPYGVEPKAIAPTLYRWYVHHEPATPPPLWDANAGYWVAHSIQVALVIGCVVTGFAVWFMGLAHDADSLKTAQRVFFISQFIGWAVAGLIGWMSTVEMRRQMRHIRRELGLPDWAHMHGDWRPSLARLQSRAVPQRYWLYSLRGNALFAHAQIAGIFGFAFLAWLIPQEVGRISTVLAIVYLFACAFAVQRTTRGKVLPRDAHLWTAGHGLAIGALIAAIVWNVVVAEVLKLPREPMVFTFALLCFAMHAWEYLMFEQDRTKALRAEAAEQARQLAEARLHALSSQIEPHFIFNTLAHLKAMIATDTAAAQKMADELSDFLRASLAALRRGNTTVADELALVRAYLGIARARLGERLTVNIRADEVSPGHALPSHLLLTLVENAVQHGIEPQQGMGCIEIDVHRVEREGTAHLLLRVTDDGVGFGNTVSSGAGIGLANVRERIAATFGPAASLRLTQNDPHGVIAELDLPLPLAEQPS